MSTRAARTRGVAGAVATIARGSSCAQSSSSTRDVWRLLHAGDVSRLLHAGGVVRVLALCVAVCALVCACAPQSNLPAPVASPAGSGNTTSSPGSAPSPGAGSSPVVPSASAAPSPSPSDAASEALPLRIAASIEPPRPQVGQEFVLHLAITNSGGRAAEGIYIATSGPWERYTVLGVQPQGQFGRDAAGWHIVSPVRVAPGATQTIDVHARADTPTDEQELTFAVREADPGDFS